MKLTRSIWQTYKEVPAEAEIPSHQLMIRAGLIHKTGSGLFTYMPFGYKVIRKVESIVREEMDKIDSQEIQMSVVTPGELWQESGRWEKMGDLMLKFKDKGERDLCISPTNEEAVTDVFRKTVKSYKQLPQSVYQINTKFRDEIRPRFGLMRAREFIMKDAYTFHLDKPCLDKGYKEMYDAYEKAFKRMGIEFVAVEADAGDMGDTDSQTHEFQAIADTGEDTIIYCQKTGYAANIEKADTLREEITFDHDSKELEEIETPNMGTIADVCNFLKVPQHHSIKSLVYSAIFGEDGEDEEIVLIQLLGDDELNELKLKNFLGANEVRPTEEMKLKKLGMVKGFIGAINLPEKMRVLVDKAIDEDAFYTTGAMKKDFHAKGFNFKRDLEEYEKVDLRLARKGDRTPDGQGVVDEKKGIELGHIFQLGDKYTKALDVKILDQNGKTMAPLMGCYGIGISRIVAAAIEQSHDENGIIWPKEIAPFDIYFATIAKSEEYKQVGEEIYKELRDAGFDTLYDDRKAGPGFKFKDSDLLGLPIRVVMGERDFKEKGELEIVIRKTNEKRFIKRDELISTLKEILKEI
ncbi:MAG: proline--tRNA ligase [Halobacteriovoraceae bacterium]|nr:proline--tRNA ligase [Halobacteriovoraceae bacterium]